MFFSPAQAAALYGHPGHADLIGVITRPGTWPRALAAHVRSVAGPRYAVATGAGRGAAENPAIAGDDSNIEGLGGSAGADIIVIALFVVAGTVALSVSQRHRQFALLRAVGATPGQVRLAVLAELAALGVLGGVAGWLPGCWLAALAVHGMIGQDLIPPGTTTWLSPWLLFIAVVSGMTIGALAGLLAARRAGRAAPADALRESAAERRWPHRRSRRWSQGWAACSVSHQSNPQQPASAGVAPSGFRPRRYLLSSGRGRLGRTVEIPAIRRGFGQAGCGWPRPG